MPDVFDSVQPDVFDHVASGGDVFDQLGSGDVQSLNKTANPEFHGREQPNARPMGVFETIGHGLEVGAAGLLNSVFPAKKVVKFGPDTKELKVESVPRFEPGVSKLGRPFTNEDVDPVNKVANDLYQGMGTPGGMVALPLMAAKGLKLAKPLMTLFGAESAEQVAQEGAQQLQTVFDPKADPYERKVSGLKLASNLTLAGTMLKHGLSVEPAPFSQEKIGPQDRVEQDKTFGDVTTQAPIDLPKDQVTTNPTFNKLDVERSRQQEVGKSGANLLRDTVLSRPSEPDVNGLQLPETTGSYGLKTRFQGPMNGPLRDLSQLSPAELAELNRGPNPVYTPPKDKTMDTPIIGEHPLTKPLANLSTAIADLQSSLNKGQIVPANQAVERPSEGGGPATGGQVSFANPANAESIPSARQSALQPNETITSNSTGPSSQVEGTTPGTLQSSVEKIRTDKGGTVEDQAGTGKVDVGGQGTESGQGLYGEGLEAKKRELIAQLKAAPTMVEKQKLWGQIEALKNTKQQEVQTVPIQSELKDKLNRYAASRKNMGEAGGIDMSALEDVVKFGKTLFKQGMDKATWTSDMVKKLGENVRPYLDEAHKNVVPAMQNRGDRTFGLQAEDVLKNPLDLKLKPDAKGEFDSGQLVGRTLNMVTPAEKQFLEDMGIRKEFPAGTRVSGEKVGEWVRDNGPKVEVRKFGAQQQTPESRELATLQHEWKDSLPYESQNSVDSFIREYMEDPESADTLSWLNQAVDDAHTANPKIVPSEFRRKALRYAELGSKVDNAMGNNAHWSSIAPKPESEMPGYVEGAVVVPQKKVSFEEFRKKYPNGPEKVLRERYESGEPLTKENPLFGSTHSFPNNTLGFFRGYMDTAVNALKNWKPVYGETVRDQLKVLLAKKPDAKIFHVIEVQSDWAHRVRDYKEKLKNPAGDWDAERGLKNSDHPLLKDWSRLTLKATVDHAIKEGADEIAVSDAETAMMTEVHDQLAAQRRQEGLQQGNQYAAGSLPEPDQAPGMRLNYDRILPDIVKELTGEEGRKVELGEHKMAYDLHQRDAQGILGYRRDAQGNVLTEGLRQNLIFRNPDNTPKTSITAQSFPLDKVKEQLKTKPFSFFGSDKPKIPSVEAVTSKLEPKPRGIVAGARAAMEKNQEAGRVGLPTKEEVGKAIDYAKSAPKRILDHIIGHGVDRETGEIVDHILAKQQGWSAPRTVSANEDVGNKLVRYASADIAADQYAKALASEALGDTHYKDTAFQDKLGKVIVEERLRALQQYHEGKNESELAASVSHVMTPAEFDSALKDPEIKAAVERHKQIVQPVAEEQHTALGGKLAAKGPETGAFANLLAVTDADSFETAKQLIYGQGNVNPRAAIKGSVFEKRATGQAPKYETNYRTVAERMISGNYKRNALRNWIDAGVGAGLYKYAKAGEPNPEMGGQPMARVPVKIKATPWGSQVVKDLWVRKDLLPEMEQALKSGGAPMKAGMQLLLNAATTAQIIGPTDMVYHTANMYASIVGSLGAKSGLRDVARKITGVKQLDAMARIGYHTYRAILDTPEVQKELADIAKIGALRDQSVHQGLLGQFNTGRLIRLVDKAGRLARNQMFDNLVERGLTKDTDVDRREFINKMGQYNSKLMSHFQATFQQYTSQFVVAGRTFNRNAFQRILMSNEVRASNPQAYWQMKALNMLGVASTLLVVPVVLNSMLNGNPWGRSGTPIGKIDTGKDDDKGRHILIDPSQTELMRRGLRITGIQSAFKGIHEDRSAKETIGRMFEDIFQGQMHPWEGPPVRVGMKYMEKYGETHDAGESLKAAMAAVNPSITTFFGGDEANPDRKGVKGVTESLAGAVGVGKSRLPTHAEKVESTAAKYGMPTDTLADRASVEKKIKDTSQPQTREGRARGAVYSIKAEAQHGKELEKVMDPVALKFVKNRGFEVPGFSDKLIVKGNSVVLKDSEVKSLQAKILANDLEVINRFRAGEFNGMTPTEQQQAFKKVISAGRLKARQELMMEMQ